MVVQRIIIALSFLIMSIVAIIGRFVVIIIIIILIVPTFTTVVVYLKLYIYYCVL